MLAGGKIRSDRGHVLIKLRENRDATCGDSVQCGLPDMSSEPERSGGQRRRKFSHI